LAKRYAAEQVTRINKETRASLKRAISESIRDGIPPREAAKQIRETVGLNRPQGIALRRHVRKLSKAGYTTAAKAKAGIKLKNKMIRRRAITIARTEVIDSLTAGVEAAWGQAQDQGLLGKNAKKEWMTTPMGACTICQALNGQQVLLTKSFISSTVGALDRPTAHPNCRCGIAPVPGMGGGIAAPPAVQATGAPASTMARMAVSADGDLLKGSDARKAILKYADDPDTPYRKKLAKAEKRYLDKQAETKGKIEPLIKEQFRIKKLEDEEILLGNKFYTPELHKKYPILADRRVIDTRTGKSVSLDEVGEKIDEFRRQRDVVKERIAKLSDHASDEFEEFKAIGTELHDDVLEKFIYNKTRNTSVDVETRYEFPLDEDPYSGFPNKVQTQILKQEKKAFDEGLDAWRRMTDDDLFASIQEGEQLGLTTQKRAAQVAIKRVNGRGHAQSFSDRNYTVNLDLRDLSRKGRGTTIHEMTHTTEFGNPDVLAEAIRWRDLKTGGNTKRKMRHWTGDDGYRDSEKAYDNGWKTNQNPEGVGEVYKGKTYSIEQHRLLKSARDISAGDVQHLANKVYTERDGWQYATEVTTMGMQEMYQNPVLLAKSQPELFDFVYERIVKRKYTHDTSEWSLRGSKNFRGAKKGDVVERSTWGYKELVDLVEEGSEDYKKARYYYLDQSTSKMEIQTKVRHSTGVDKQGNTIYTPQRLKLHNEILEDTLKGATPVDRPEVIVLGGGPASGKTAAKTASQKRFKGNAAAVDTDEIRTKLPEYAELLKKKSVHAAAITHEEASELGKRIFKEGQRRKLNMIADGTGDTSYEAISKKVAGYRANGATKVFGNYVSIDTDEAMKRMTGRAKKTGRWVPEEVLRSTHESVSQIVPRAIKDDLFDSFTLWDNNAEGKAAEVVASWSKGKKLEIADDRMWRSFLAKGNEGLETVEKKVKWPLLDTDTRKVTVAEVNKVEQYYTKYGDNLPKTTRRNLVSYTGEGYEQINKKLRANPDHLADRAKSIQKAANDAPTPPPPELVWRGVNGTIMDGKKDGDVFELNGFQSTTLNPYTGGFYRKQASRSGDGVLLEIIPSKGVYLGRISQHAGEEEFLLPHKAKYRIVGRKKVKLESSNGKYSDVLNVMQVQMLP